MSLILLLYYWLYFFLIITFNKQFIESNLLKVVSFNGKGLYTSQYDIISKIFSYGDIISISEFRMELSRFGDQDLEKFGIQTKFNQFYKMVLQKATTVVVDDIEYAHTFGLLYGINSFELQDYRSFTSKVKEDKGVVIVNGFVNGNIKLIIGATHGHFDTSQGYVNEENVSNISKALQYISSLGNCWWYIAGDFNLNTTTIEKNLAMWRKIVGPIFTTTHYSTNVVTNITSKGNVRIDHIITNIPIIKENFIYSHDSDHINPYWIMNIISGPQLQVKNVDDNLVVN